MVSIDPGTAREFLEGVIAAFAVLGGVMAYFSGFEASKALAEDQPPATVAQCVNEGIGAGFDFGVWAAIVALMIMGWT
jgi:hypothetical protein